MSRRKAMRPKTRVTKDGIATAVRQLNVAHENLDEVGSFMFVCIQALSAKTRDDVVPDVATVLGTAYDKLALDVNRNVRDALQALGQDGGK